MLFQLARADFRVRYKRAYLGLVWAVLLPLVQATVLAAVFSHFVRLQHGAGANYAVFVLAGVLPWSYFASSVTAGSTAIVDGSDLTDKLWFPRAILPIASALANLVGLLVSMVALAAATLAFGVPLSPDLVLLVPGCVLLVLLTGALSLVLSALHAYFRDVRYIVQAALLIGFYVSPIIYPPYLLQRYSGFLDFNPITGVLDVFRQATGQSDPHIGRALLVTFAVTIAATVIAVEAYRRHDRLFVDTL